MYGLNSIMKAGVAFGCKLLGLLSNPLSGLPPFFELLTRPDAEVRAGRGDQLGVSQ